MSQTKSQRAILTEDGELRTVDAEPSGEAVAPDTHKSGVFCCNCGTANQASSRFCRNCGQSLDEQALNPASLDAYAPPEQKNKRSGFRELDAPHMTPEDRGLMIEVFTLLVLGVLGAVSIATQQIALALIILLVWLVSKVLSRRGASSDH